MPNLLKQDVHTYITALLSEILGREEGHGEPSRSRLPADSDVKQKESETDSLSSPE